MRIQNLASHPVAIGATALDGAVMATNFLPHDQYLTSAAETALDAGGAIIHGSATLINAALCFQATHSRGEGGPYAMRAWAEALKAGGYMSAGLGVNPLYGVALVAGGSLLSLCASASQESLV